MFFPEGRIVVRLYGRPVDMRRSFDGLCALTRHELKEDPLSGALFVFVNRRGTQMKCLYFDRSGFCIWSKRLESGRFIGDWSCVRTRSMQWSELKLLIDGLEAVKQRKRFALNNSLQHSTALDASSR
jgi:transposase